jgi:hypothetical protein
MANEEHVAQLRKGVANWSDWRNISSRGKPGQRAF